MANIEIRDAVHRHRLLMWQIAAEYGVSEGTFSRKLRRELPDVEKRKIMGIIERLAQEPQEVG